MISVTENPLTIVSLLPEGSKSKEISSSGSLLTIAVISLEGATNAKLPSPSADIVAAIVIVVSVAFITSFSPSYLKYIPSRMGDVVLVGTAWDTLFNALFNSVLLQ